MYCRKMGQEANDIAAEIFHVLNQWEASPSVGMAAMSAALVTGLIYHGYDKAHAMEIFGKAWDHVAEDADEIRFLRKKRMQ